MKVWIISCRDKGLLYERRPYLSEAKAKESLAYLRKKYPKRVFTVTSIYHPYDEQDERL